MQPPRSEGQGRLLETPIVAGETDEDGLLEIRESHAGEVRLSASHPAYGYSHAEVELPAAEPVVIRMKMPGELVGRLTEAGRAPAPGKWSLVLEPRGRPGVRGAMFDMPKMTVPNLDGDFRSSGLRPGAYRIRVIRSVKALGSPGGLIGFMMREQFMNQTVTKDITIASGQVLHVELDAIKAPRQVQGPSARVSGVVLINGRPGAGMMVTASRRGKSSNGVAVDEGGRFDLGPLEVGKWSVTLRGQPDLVDVRMSSHVWKQSVEIKDGEAVSLDISVSTGRSRIRWG